MKVLVIEDDPTVGNFIKRGLEEQRWGVQLVDDGEEGERAALAEEFDVVILDMRLPGKNGMEVLHTLRARGFERPVLVLTAQDAVDAKVRTLRGGADDYVTKPFAFEELERRHIETVLHNTNWHQGKAATALGISSKTLYRKIREYNFRRPGGEE